MWSIAEAASIQLREGVERHHVVDIPVRAYQLYRDQTRLKALLLIKVMILVYHEAVCRNVSALRETLLWTHLHADLNMIT